MSNPIETPRQLLHRKVQEYLDRQSLLQQIIATAKPAKGGFVISAELMEQIRKLAA